MYIICGAVILSSVFISYSIDKKNQEELRSLFLREQNEIIDRISYSFKNHQLALSCGNKNVSQNKYYAFFGKLMDHHPDIEISISKKVKTTSYREIYSNFTFKEVRKRKFNTLTDSQELSIKDETFIINFKTSPKFGKQINRSLSVMVLIIGLIISLSIFAILWVQQKSKKLALILAAERTHELFSANTELDEFAYRISHDLSGPLKTAIGLSIATKKSVLKNDYKSAIVALDISLRSLTNLDHLVNNIQILTGIKRNDEAKSKFNPNNEIEKIVNNAVKIVGLNNLQINYDLKFKGNLITKKNCFNLIIEKLVSNAIKFQDSTKKPGYIKISTYKSNFAFMLSIEDNGIGIPKKFHSQIFDMFTKFHPKNSSGSGLGLYIAQKSAKLVNGEINYVGLKQGSKFIVHIPIN